MSQNPTVFVLIVSLFLLGLGVVLLGFFNIFFRPDAVQDRLKKYVARAAGERGREPTRERTRFNRIREWLNNTLSILASEELQIRLSSADWPVSDTEYILLRFAGSILGFLMGWGITQYFLGGVALALVVYMVPGMLLFRGMYLRQRKFQGQLLDVLVLIRGAVQSGYSLLQSLDVVINEIAPPASDEFERVVREVKLGVPLSQALLNLSQRMDSDDLHLIVTAIIINSEVGGSLAMMLGAVISTIRDRIYLFGEVRSLTSYARYTGYFLTFLPFIAALAIFLVNPQYFSGALESDVTRMIFIVAFIGLVVGNIWLRQIVKIDV